MAEVLLGAAASAAGGGATAAATTTAAAGASSLSTILGILSGVATVASVVGGLQSAEASAHMAETNALDATLEEGQQRNQAAQRGSAMKRELARILGENDVAIAAAGIDLSGGIATSSRAAAKADAARELSIDRGDDESRRAMLKARANGYRRQASSYRAGGMLAAVGKAAEFGIGLAERG